MLELTSYKMEEHKGSNLYWQNSIVEFDRYNLIIGKNASGKSQLFNRLSFLKSIHVKNSQTPSIISTAKFELTFRDIDSNEVIIYDLTVHPGQLLTEKITNSSKNIVLFSSETKEFFNEQEKKQVKQLFPPQHSVTKLISGSEKIFPTIKKLGDFFEGVRLLRTDKYNPSNLAVGPGHFIPDENLNNLGSVVLQWKQSMPHLYTELLNTFKTFFFEIQDFVAVNLPNIPYPILGFAEKNVSEVVNQIDCSMGMLRVLGIIALSISKDSVTGKVPSLIIIDEIDNGLDYENVGSILEYLVERSTDSQIFFSSHSPVTCNFISPSHWRVFSRKGIAVHARVPTENPETAKLLQDAKMTNWEIYQKHISKSKLYTVQ
ncbi:MAG: AAA family ATPase [Bdellovibrionales bacterium]